MKEFRVAELAQTAGMSTRTLRYYDTIGLLRPLRTDSNGYRLYGSAEVDRLQQILLYRELGMKLEDIGAILDAPSFDPENALREHLAALKSERDRLDRLINNVSKTINAVKGDKTMTDSEKFEGFKAELIKKNEEKYGEEVIKKYGKDSADAYNRKVKAMSEEQWKTQEETEAAMLENLRAAMEKGDPASPEAIKAADLHRQWLCFFWQKGMYSPTAHRAMAAGYTADSRFTDYYDSKAGTGATDFLRRAIEEYTKE